jgi:hypothetical protein
MADRARQRRFSSSMKGKTIAKVDAACVNSIGIVFTDGTSIELEVEYYPPVYGISLQKLPKVKK